MRRSIVGVMGPGDGATATEQQCAYELGRQIAQQGWILLTGGRNAGVMEAASQGAKQANGLTIGILPDSRPESVSQAVDIAIFTNMGNARNHINILSSDIVIACGMGTGTASEVALALKESKWVILLGVTQESQLFFQSLAAAQIFIANDPEAAIAITKSLLQENSASRKFGS